MNIQDFSSYYYREIKGVFLVYHLQHSTDPNGAILIYKASCYYTILYKIPHRKYGQTGISAMITKAQHVKFQMCVSE